MTEYRIDIPGFKVERRAARNITLATIHYTAHPHKRDPAWAAEGRKAYPSEVRWKREMEMDWTSREGEPFFPEFAARPQRYLRPLPYLVPGLPVYRGWDFGTRHPACVWFQRGRNGRVWFGRELLGVNIDPYSFRDLVRFISGDIPEEALEHRPRAMEHVRAIRENPEAYSPPFFAQPPTIRWADYAGHEALQMRWQVENQPKTTCDQEILAEVGIELQPHYTTTEAKEHVWRRLMHTMADGGPGCYVDPIGCPILAQALGGGLVYAKGTKENPAPDTVQKDEYFSHLWEAASYPLVNAAPVTESQAATGHAPAEEEAMGLMLNELLGE
jgi:hypothetical protein